MWRQIKKLLVVSVFLLAAFSMFTILKAEFKAKTINNVGKIVYYAPDFTLTDIDGIEFSLSDQRGKVVLLDFFADCCGPCIAKTPHIKSLHEEFGEELVIISISVSPEPDTIEKLQEFRQEYNMNWIVAKDTARMNDKYNIQYIPTLVIVDQKGYIKHRHVGLTEASILHEEISEIVHLQSPKYANASTGVRKGIKVAQRCWSKDIR